MTVCNMSIEAGARAGMVAPDDTTFAYLEGRPHAPKGADWEQALDDWRTLPTDAGATFDSEVTIDVAALAPQVTWGTNPEHGRRRSPAACPIPAAFADPTRARRGRARARLHGARAGHADRRTSRSTASSSARARTRGSRTCARRRRSCAGRHVAPSVRAMVVPGSATVKRAGRGRRARPGLHRRRLRVARGRLLDVPRHEPRHPRSRASAAPRPPTATSKAGRAAAAARTSSARRWPPRPRSPATSSTSRELGDGMEAVHAASPARSRCSTAPTSTPTRSSRSSSSSGSSAPASASSCSSTGASTQDGDRPRLRAEPARIPGRADPRRRRATSAAAPRASTPPGRSQDYGFQRGDRALVRRHLLHQLLQDRPPPVVLPPAELPRADRRGGWRRRGRGRPGAAADRRPEGTRVPFDFDPFRRHCLLNGLDDIAHAAHDDRSRPTRRRIRRA